MIIGDRIRTLRIKKKLTQADIQERTGLVRPYISRVENGHTIPSVETIEKFARALGLAMYELFYDENEPLTLTYLPKRKTAGDVVFGSKGKEAHFMNQFRNALGNINSQDRSLLYGLAKKMAGRREK